MAERVFKEVFVAKTRGEIDVDKPIRITLSDRSVDRHGDIVEGFSNLKQFLRDNPILLWQHDTDNPIGKLVRLWEEGTKTIGEFLLGEEGTSPLVDAVRSMVRQGIIRAGSVGFRPGEAASLDPDRPFGGQRLSDNELFEFSLVSVPANAGALMHAKHLDSRVRQLIFGEPAEAFKAPAAVQLGLAKSLSSEKPSRRTDSSKVRPMSLSKKIEARQKDLGEMEDQLKTLIAEEPEGEEAIEQNDLQVEELTKRVDAANDELERLRAAEKALARKALAAGDTGDDDGGSSHDVSDAARFSGGKRKREKGQLALQSIGVLVRSKFGHRSNSDVIKSEFAPEDRNEVEMMTRAATAPADMSTPAWAGNLVREGWGEYLDLLRDVSVYPSVPGLRMTFESNGKINLPRDDARGALSGGFVAENAPIPVKQGVIGSADLEPKMMGVISSYGKKLAMHTAPAIGSIISTKMLGDTAEALDSALLGAAARTAVQPAGLQDATETGAANINAASGGTVAAIIADTTDMVGRVLTARVANTGAWIMHPLNVLRLRNKQDAASGEFVFRADLAAGVFQGFPYIVSSNVPATVLYMVGGGVMAFASDFAPMVEVDESATLVFDDATPEHIVDGGLATTQPVQSMYQINGVAIKLTLGLDWRQVRANGVQVLTGVAW